MFTIPQVVITVLESILIVLGAYFVLFWFGIVAWTFQDIRHRSHDWMVQILAVLMVLVFHVAGLFIYLILRPAETLAVVFNRSLEEEALMQGMEEKLACPRCHKPAQPDFAVCPYCGEALKHQCASCGRLLNLNWTICPSCTTPVKPGSEDLPEAQTSNPQLVEPVA